MTNQIPVLRAIVAAALNVEVTTVTPANCDAALLLTDEQLLAVSLRKDISWIRSGIQLVKRWLTETQVS